MASNDSRCACSMNRWHLFSTAFPHIFPTIHTPLLNRIVGRLTYRFYRDSRLSSSRAYLLSSFFFVSYTLPARWTELSQNRPHARKWVWFENVCPTSGIYPPPTYRGSKTHLFSTTSQLNGNFKGLYLWNETCMTYIIGQVRWKLQRVAYIVSKYDELWSTNGLKLDHPL